MLDSDSDDVQRLLSMGGRLIHGGMERREFIDAFRHGAPSLAPAIFPDDAANPDTIRRAAGAFAFALWRAMPSPHHGWRPPSAPLPGRNEPCFCGSGQKFKRCCAGIPVPTEMLQQVNLLRFVLDACTAKELESLPLDHLDPIALGDVATQWVDEGESKRAARLLEPLFLAPQRLDARHVEAFDALMSAWLVLDRPRKRKELLDTLLRHPDAGLADAARQREVSILADQGEWDIAWSKFRDLLRHSPDDPALAYLEITLLKGQERDDEAVARAEFWSARLRQLDPRLAGYADALLAMTSGEGAPFAGEEAAPPFVLMCEQLLKGAPAAQAAYHLELQDGLIELRPSRDLERIEKAWRKEFPLAAPDLTSFETKPDPVIDRIPATIGFLDKNPLAWQSFRVLDDLALVAHAMGSGEPFDRFWFALQRKLGERAEQLLACLLPPSLQPPPHLDDDTSAAHAHPIEEVALPAESLPWTVLANRPALRLIALQIEARERLWPADPRIELLMAWMLRVNPDDNHGYRSLLAQRWLRESRPSAALALLERYPDEIGAALADRILALYLLDRRDEAAALLVAEGRWLTEILAALLAASYRRPRELDERFLVIGGRGEAWLYREAMRATWESSGALRWLKEHRPRAGPAGKASRASGSRKLGVPKTGIAIETARRRLAEVGGDAVRTHGAMVATALAPDIGSPAGWISRLFSPADGPGPAFTSTDDAQSVLDGLTGWYNLVVMEVGPASQDGPRLGSQATPWLDNGSSDAVTRWAAGFMACVVAEPAAWVKLRPYPELLAPLRQLAARVPLSAAEKADPSLIRNRGDGDAPLLAAVDDAEPAALLVNAVERLVQRVGLLRKAAPAR